jgi:hypothetical protein
MNSLPKYVVSATTLEGPGWNNSTVLDGGLVEAVSALKHTVDGEIRVYASSQLVPDRRSQIPALHRHPHCRLRPRLPGLPAHPRRRRVGKTSGTGGYRQSVTGISGRSMQLPCAGRAQGSVLGLALLEFVGVEHDSVAYPAETRQAHRVGFGEFVEKAAA